MKSNPEPGHYLMNNDAFVFFSRLLFLRPDAPSPESFFGLDFYAETGGIYTGTKLEISLIIEVRFTK